MDPITQSVFPKTAVFDDAGLWLGGCAVADLSLIHISIGLAACQAIQIGSVVPGETSIVDPHAGASGGIPAATRFKPSSKGTS